ncbi:MAG: hypothetical protein AAF351_06950 [Pseudomonadota bacterium]
MAKLFLIWAGLVFGVSFLATPAKFLAPDLDLSTALQVGRVTFRVFSYVEAFLIVLTVGLAWKQFGSTLRHYLWPFVLTILLLVQYFVVLPIVAQHTDAVTAGDAVSSSSAMHQVYVVFEVIKAGLLLWLGIQNPFAAYNVKPNRA